MKKLKVVQIGTAHAHAFGALQTLLDLSDVFELAAVGEPEPERLNTLKADPKYAGIRFCTPEEALDIPGLDGAIIEVWEQDLTQYAQMAADRGLHIQMDKPGGESTEAFRRLMETVKEKSLVFQPGYMYRFNPAVKKAVEIAESGVLGEIFSVEAQMSIDMGEAGRGLMSRYTGGMMYFLGCHLADVVYRILGMPEKVLPMNCATHYPESLDYGMAVYQYKNGVSFIKTCASEVNGFLRRQIVITGTEGSVEIEPVELFVQEDPRYLETSLRLSLKKDAWSPNFDCSTRMTFPRYKRYDEMFLHFARMVNGETDPFYTPDRELDVFRLVMKSCNMV